MGRSVTCLQRFIPQASPARTAMRVMNEMMQLQLSMQQQLQQQMQAQVPNPPLAPPEQKSSPPVPTWRVAPAPAVDHGGVAGAPMQEQHFVRLCNRCGKISYFREQCCLNPECETRMKLFFLLCILLV